jgi:MoaA/NifB/PqqE/SkfB family radical SAM enzyme
MTALPPPPPFPTRVSVEVTNHCNQRCVLCPRQGFTRPLGFMDPGVFHAIAEECARYGARLWLHFLGEPLLHPELVALIRDAKRAGIREVGLSTNAVTLKGALAEALLDSGLDRLECSIDANDAEHYQAMRGRDHFARITANVRAFLERKRARGLARPVTSLQFMRTPAVEAELDDLVRAWRAALGPDDFVMTIAPVAFGGAIDVPPAGADPRRPCHWLFSSLMVLQDGTITMCGADWDAGAPLGRVPHQTLTEVWTGPVFAARRAAHLEGRFAAVAICAGCEDWRLADGRGYVNVSAATP